MRLLRFLVFASVLLASADAAGASSLYHTGHESPTDPPRLLSKGYVFVGTIDSVLRFAYEPTLRLGVTPGTVTGVAIRVSEVLHGSGLTRGEFMASDLPPVAEALGTRVLLVANRTSAFDNRLWGVLLRVIDQGRLAPIRMPGSVMSSGYPEHLYLPWLGPPTLADLRSLDPLYRGSSTYAPLAAAATLDLVRVEAADSVASDRVALRLRWLRQLAGPEHEGTQSWIVDLPSHGGGNVMPVIGDSLVFPSTNGAPMLGFARRPGDYLVDRGFLSSFDTPFEDLAKLIVPRGTGFVLLRKGSLTGAAAPGVPPAGD